MDVQRVKRSQFIYTVLWLNVQKTNKTKPKTKKFEALLCHDFNYPHFWTFHLFSEIYMRVYGD